MQSRMLKTGGVIKVKQAIPGICFILFSSMPLTVSAAKWEIDPSVTVRETYTDNIDLDSSNENDALVTEITPQISARGEGARLKVDLNYRLQNVLRSGGSQGNSTNHQLRANANAELVENLFFLDANSTVGQTNNSSSGRRTGDNLVSSADRGNFWTAGFSPYLTPHFGGYADGEVRYRYNTVNTSGGNASDSDTHQQLVSFRSGTRFKTLSWRFSHSNREEKRDSSGAEDPKFQETKGEVRWRLTDEFSAFVQAGNFDSDFAGVNNTDSRTNNGSYITYGGAWRPSRKFSVEAGVGDRNSFVTVNLNPTTRTSWSTTFRDSDVGTNTGQTWDSRLSLRTRRTNWEVRYFEDISTFQQTLLEQQIFALVDSSGAIIVDPATGLPVLIALDIPTAIDEVFRRQRGEFSFIGRRAKSTFNLKAYTEKREYQESGRKEDVVGWNGSWNWRLTARTNSILSIRWQNTKGDTISALTSTPIDDTYSSVSLRLNRRITPNSNGFVELRRAEQKSDNSTNDYDENRITAGITVHF